MSGAHPVIALNTQPHTPVSIMAACVRDANTVYIEGQKQYIENVRKLATLVLQAHRYAKKASVSFRSLFPDGDGGERAAGAQFVFSRAKGMMLLAIARNSALMSGQHVDQLPGDYNALSQLAQIPAPKLTKLIEAGKVKASMGRSAVVELVTTSTKPAKTATKANVKASNPAPAAPAIPTANSAELPLPKIAGGVPIASPRASCAVEIPDDGEKIANAVNGDRDADLECVKATITDYAEKYGWGAAAMDLATWIEEQVEAGR